MTDSFKWYTEDETVFGFSLEIKLQFKINTDFIVKHKHYSYIKLLFKMCVFNIKKHTTLHPDIKVHFY